MLTIISGTNRAGSNTYRVALEYQRLLKEKGFEAGILSLEGLPLAQYSPEFTRIEEEVIIPTSHFIILSPEYNGSFPGVLKMMFDLSRSHEIWFHKKALLTGISSGRAGNLRGMDHLSDILNFVKVTVHPNKLPLSAVNRLLDAEGKLADPATLKAINQQLDEFLNWIKHT
ncbi:MAG: NAD(P)H-dependent oxidoreductase [Chitinophagaceae bacterium]|nr:NAD(P)H-dependent oxidoreductase [Chitinophagaceae bacterium]MBL0056393.1 NAD(P)H-dependent oxidoreductase [Chitinophagaceae bacterium]